VMVMACLQVTSCDGHGVSSGNQLNSVFGGMGETGDKSRKFSPMGPTLYCASHVRDA